MLLVLDEPTTGLDSLMAENVVKLLKKLSEKGKTVICTIHQPSSQVFSMFNRLLLLSEGRTAFLGKPNDAVAFLAKYVPGFKMLFKPFFKFCTIYVVLNGFIALDIHVL